MKSKFEVYTPETLRETLGNEFEGFDTSTMQVDSIPVRGWEHPFLVGHLPHPWDRMILGRAFGIAYYYRNVTLVRSELAPGVRRNTVAHEMGHLTDFMQWRGRYVDGLTPLVNELGAHVYSIIYGGLPDFVAAVATTLLSPERRAFYFDRVRTGDKIGG